MKHRYRIHPTDNINLRKRVLPQSLRSQYQVQNNTKIRKSQKVVENNRKVEVKNYPKKTTNSTSVKIYTTNFSFWQTKQLIRV